MVLVFNIMKIVTCILQLINIKPNKLRLHTTLSEHSSFSRFKNIMNRFSSASHSDYCWYSGYLINLRANSDKPAIVPIRGLGDIDPFIAQSNVRAGFFLFYE